MNNGEDLYGKGKRYLRKFLNVSSGPVLGYMSLLLMVLCVLAKALNVYGQAWVKTSFLLCGYFTIILSILKCIDSIVSIIVTDKDITTEMLASTGIILGLLSLLIMYLYSYAGVTERSGLSYVVLGSVVAPLYLVLNSASGKKLAFQRLAYSFYFTAMIVALMIASINGCENLQKYIPLVSVITSLVSIFVIIWNSVFTGTKGLDIYSKWYDMIFLFISVLVLYTFVIRNDTFAVKQFFGYKLKKTSV